MNQWQISHNWVHTWHMIQTIKSLNIYNYSQQQHLWCDHLMFLHHNNPTTGNNQTSMKHERTLREDLNEHEAQLLHRNQVTLHIILHKKQKSAQCPVANINTVFIQYTCCIKLCHCVFWPSVTLNDLNHTFT